MQLSAGGEGGAVLAKPKKHCPNAVARAAGFCRVAAKEGKRNAFSIPLGRVWQAAVQVPAFGGLVPVPFLFVDD